MNEQIIQQFGDNNPKRMHQQPNYSYIDHMHEISEKFRKRKHSKVPKDVSEPQDEEDQEDPLVQHRQHVNQRKLIHHSGYSSDNNNNKQISQQMKKRELKYIRKVLD